MQSPGTIIINGGIINASSGTGSAIGGGGYTYSSTATGAGGTIIIRGGQVTATSTQGYGIGKGKNTADSSMDGADGTITLSWTNVDDDFIQASSFAGTVVLEKNFFYEDGETGVTLDNLAAHAGEKIIPSTVETDKNLAYATISGVSTTYLYTGNVITLTPVVTDFLGRALTLGTDYDLTISPATVQEQGDYTLTISPSTGSTYTESLTIGFTVTDYLQSDGAGGYYVTMPVTGAIEASLVAHDIAKVYDDGGSTNNFSRNADGTLLLLAPEGTVIHLAGTVDVAWESQIFTVYDGATTDATVLGTYNADATISLFSTGTQMLLHFVTSTAGTSKGLDLTAIAKPQMAESEWNLLQTAYQQMGSGEGWTSGWVFNVDTRLEQTLPGITTYQGHVTAIDLSGNNLTGTFPTTLLSLPQLTSLNLSNNALSGDITVLSGLPAEAALQSLDISGNQFEGNIGVFAAQLPNLTSLIANNNCLSEVNPMIATTVTTLNLGVQTIDRVVTLDLSDLTAATLLQQLPTILTYNHTAQEYKTAVDFLLSTDYDDWSIQLRCNGTTVSFPSVVGQNHYHGQNGASVKATLLNNYYWNPEGSTLQVKLVFADGDSNFNGSVDVTDLQAQINYSFEEYSSSKPFNFTAADLLVDNVINVLDVVKMVDILLQTSPNQARRQTEALTERTAQ